MDDMAFIIYNGEIRPADQPAVPVTSRGLMYGDGCFETLRSYRGRFLKLDEHIRRLKAGLDFLSINYPRSLKRTELGHQIKLLLVKNGLSKKDAVMRIQVWRKGKRGYSTRSAEADYAITATPVPKPKPACRLATVDIKKIPSQSRPSRYKWSNGINYILAANQAAQKGADDALMETIENNISETTIANIFWLKNERVYTPSIDSDILPGVTRSIVLELLKKELSVGVVEDSFSMDGIKSADCVWICNSVKEIQPVSSIDNVQFEVEVSFIQTLNAAFRQYREAQLQGLE